MTVPMWLRPLRWRPYQGCHRPQWWTTDLKIDDGSGNGCNRRHRASRAILAESFPRWSRWPINDRIGAAQPAWRKPTEPGSRA